MVVRLRSGVDSAMRSGVGAERALVLAGAQRLPGVLILWEKPEKSVKTWQLPYNSFGCHLVTETSDRNIRPYSSFGKTSAR